MNIDVSLASDGYHTFDELYEHRHALFTCLANLHTGQQPYAPWKSWKHENGTSLEGWFIAGMTLLVPFLATGTPSEHLPITYHLPARLWHTLHVEVRERAPHWDLHTSADVVERLYRWAQFLGPLH